MRRVENTEMNQTRGFIEALRLILATPGPSQIPWMRIKPLGSRWEVMNLPSLQAWKSGLLLWSAKWWETPEQRKSRTSTPTNKASKASGPHFQLPMAAAAPEESLFPRFLAAVCDQGSRAPRIFIYLLRAPTRPVQNVPKSWLPS